MADIPLADLLIDTFTKGLRMLDHLLTKAEEHARAAGLDADAIFPNARLIDDQLPLFFQVQQSIRSAKSAIIRFTGGERPPAPPYEDTDEKMADLHARIREGLEWLGEVNRSAIPPGVDNEVVLQVNAGKYGEPQVTVPAKRAALMVGVPNFYWHLVTAYSILRAKGVPLGKSDYLASFFEE